jgi:methionyl-tRNA formyltransferase
MKTIFAGSPHFAAYMLRALLDNGVEVVAVLTQPDKPKGRGLKIKAIQNVITRAILIKIKMRLKNHLK